ncbi:uncharacterized protein LOC118203595 [Stegodyphus dumicola]|uniref:uncharacterized protein LOC118203595 n=1 Tax=Stegodyphus dumicola TaxID=202533 RepID=UPI0015AB193A|nr:uncharacterized protein LOC118203595 [Stegodyphus dumicola]
MPRQRQNDESDGSQSQKNVDDKQQLQPQRLVRRQLRHPYFRQYCSYIFIGLPRNVGCDGNEDEQNERKNEERVSGGGRDNHWNPRRFYQKCFKSKILYHRNDTECSQPRGQGSRSCPLYRSKMGCRKTHQADSRAKNRSSEAIISRTTEDNDNDEVDDELKWPKRIVRKPLRYKDFV